MKFTLSYICCCRACRLDLIAHCRTKKGSSTKELSAPNSNWLGFACFAPR